MYWYLLKRLIGWYDVAQLWSRTSSNTRFAKTLLYNSNVKFLSFFQLLSTTTKLTKEVVKWKVERVFKIKTLLWSASVKDHGSVNSKSAEEIRLLTSFCIYCIFLVKWNISLIIMDIIICVVIYLCSVSCYGPNSYLSVLLCCNDNSTVHIIFPKNERCKWNPEFLR